MDEPRYAGLCGKTMCQVSNPGTDSAKYPSSRPDAQVDVSGWTQCRRSQARSQGDSLIRSASC